MVSKPEVMMLMRDIDGGSQLFPSKLKCDPPMMAETASKLLCDGNWVGVGDR